MKRILPFIIFTFLSSCVDKDISKTTIQIEENNRHYHPILTGQQLDITFNVKNTGENLFILSDIMTSCGCITVEEETSIGKIPPGKTRRLILKYDSTKNIGYVKHYITLYGNLADKEQEEIIFDLNVVPDSHYTKDYEEQYKSKKGSVLKDIIDGNKNTKRYYAD